MSDDQADLGYTREDKVWMAVLFGGGGMLILLASPWIVRWAADFDVLPFKAVLTALGTLDEPWAWVLRPVIGLVVGLVATGLLVADEHRLVVASDAITVVHDRDRRRIDRSRVIGVHLDGKKVVIEGTGGVLFEKPVEAKRDRVRAAFVERDYPWNSA